MESSGYSSKTLRKGSCPYAPLDEVLRYIFTESTTACFFLKSIEFLNEFSVFFAATTVHVHVEEIFQSSNYPESTSNNSYNYWNFQAPEGLILSVFFHEMVIEPPWNEHTYFCFGENVATFSKSTDLCSPWSCLTEKNSELQPIFMKFATRTSSLKFIFSSVTPGFRFSVKIRPMKMYGKNCHYSYLE